MIRTILALALGAFLAGCDTTNSSSVPSGAEAPRLTVTVLTGTKAAPVDSPTVRVAWEHESGVQGAVFLRKSSASAAVYSDYITATTARDTVFRLACSDSANVIVRIWPAAGVDTTSIAAAMKSWAQDSSKTVYCKK